MVTEFRDLPGGTICNTHLLGSIPLNELPKNQNPRDTWQKIHPKKINYIYHITLSNIHSRLDRIYSSQNLNIIDSKMLPFLYSDRQNSCSRILEINYLNSGARNLPNSFPEFLARIETATKRL